MPEEQNEVEVGEEKPRGGLVKYLLFGGAGVIVLLAGIFAGPAIQNIFSSPSDEETAAEEEIVVDANEPEIYHSLHPPLVVNFHGASGSHFMQVTLEVMARKQEIINAVREHTPAIRNELILLFGASEYETVVTREGKEQMLENALAEIRKVLEQRSVESAVEAVYFTSLIIQ